MKKSDNSKVLYPGQPGKDSAINSCPVMVTGINSMPTGTSNLGCGEGNFIKYKQLSFDRVWL